VIRNEAGIKASAYEAMPVNSLYVHIYVSSPHHAFSGNSTQLKWHDGIHLSLVYTDYSFSS